MTIKELSQLYWLNREIEADKKRLEELSRVAGDAGISHLTGMPHAPSSNDSKVERLVAEITDLQAVIAAKQIQCIHERNRLERWINDIPDSLTRLVFRYRFINGLPWVQVAASIGDGTSEGSVKMICHRYIKAYNRQNKQS